MLVKLLRLSVTDSDWSWAAVTVFCYFFMLRMPSEFFWQFETCKLHAANGQWTFGPIWRKARGQCTIQRWCCCKAAKELCMHRSAPIVLTFGGEGQRAGARWWLSKLHKYLALLGVEARGWGTHCCRTFTWFHSHVFLRIRYTLLG